MRLQKRRKECGISQRVLAERASIPLRTLQAYESGYRSINGATITTIYKLAKALECRPEDILEDF